jgi:hypothetical protein
MLRTVNKDRTRGSDKPEIEYGINGVRSLVDR